MDSESCLCCTQAYSTGARVHHPTRATGGGAGVLSDGGEAAESGKPTAWHGQQAVYDVENAVPTLFLVG